MLDGARRRAGGGTETPLQAGAASTVARLYQK